MMMIVILVISDRGYNLPNTASGKKCLTTLNLASMPISSVPCRLSSEATRAFQEIYHEEFGEQLSDDEAQVRGAQLLKFFAILTQSDGNRAK